MARSLMSPTSYQAAPPRALILSDLQKGQIHATMTGEKNGGGFPVGWAMRFLSFYSKHNRRTPVVSH